MGNHLPIFSLPYFLYSILYTYSIFSVTSMDPTLTPWIGKEKGERAKEEQNGGLGHSLANTLSLLHTSFCSFFSNHVSGSRKSSCKGRHHSVHHFWYREILGKPCFRAWSRSNHDWCSCSYHFENHQWKHRHKHIFTHLKSHKQLSCI